MSVNEQKTCTGETGLHRLFPDQPVHALPTNYVLNPGDTEAVLDARAVYVYGRVLSLIFFACRFSPDREVFLYLTVSPQAPFVIDGVYVPIQEVSSCHCLVEGSAVLRAGRAVRGQGRRIVGGAHSHGAMGAFSSGTDRAQMVQLAREVAGWEKTVALAIEGEVYSEKNAGGSPLPCDLKVRFPGLSGKLEIKSPSVRLVSQDIQIGAQHVVRQVASTFLTANSRGEFYVPAIVRKTSCWACGSSETQFVEARDVHVHVLGPLALSDQDTVELHAALKSRVQLSNGVSGSQAVAKPNQHL